jgi:hypothetical protein
LALVKVSVVEQRYRAVLEVATRVLLRTRPRPLTWDQARLLRGARPAGPPPRPSAEPITVQRAAGSTGVIMAAGQCLRFPLGSGTRLTRAMPLDANCLRSRGAGRHAQLTR